MYMMAQCEHGLCTGAWGLVLMHLRMCVFYIRRSLQRRQLAWFLVFQHICKISASLIARLQANTLTQKPPLHIQDSHVEVFHLIQQNPPRVIYIKLLSVSARKSKSEDPICVSPSRWLCCFLPGSIGSPGLFFWQGTKPNSFVSVKIASIKAVPKSGQWMC